MRFAAALIRMQHALIEGHMAAAAAVACVQVVHSLGEGLDNAVAHQVVGLIVERLLAAA